MLSGVTPCNPLHITTRLEGLQINSQPRDAGEQTRGRTEQGREPKCQLRLLSSSAHRGEMRWRKKQHPHRGVPCDSCWCPPTRAVRVWLIEPSVDQWFLSVLAAQLYFSRDVRKCWKRMEQYKWPVVAGRLGLFHYFSVNWDLWSQVKVIWFSFHFKMSSLFLFFPAAF